MSTASLASNTAPQWETLYGVAPSKVWNVDASAVLRSVDARPAPDAGQCRWVLEEWADGSFSGPQKKELALLLRATCDGTDDPQRTRFMIVTARTRQVATGTLFVAGRVVLEAEVPFARMGGYAPHFTDDARNEVLLDTSRAETGSARLVRVEHGALVTEHDFGRLGMGCPGAPLLSFRTRPGEVEFRDSSHVCDPSDAASNALRERITSTSVP